jgi:glycosyltransferase involved in cell wall biosynthesis
MIKISAIVMIFNEEEQIRACLETIKWVDEIVICDSFSTDRTVEICREYTDKIYQRKFDNFGNQKKWTLDKPSNEWVLFVEADERFTPGLRDEILERLNCNEGYDGYWIPFKNFIFGKQMKGKFWDFKKIRLYRKQKGDWEGRKVHGKFILHGQAGELKNLVLHYPYRNLKVFWGKFNLMTNLEAQELLRNNRRLYLVDTLKAILWVPLTFFNLYVVWKDYKSGGVGLVFSLLSSPYNLLVNIKYWLCRLR